MIKILKKFLLSLVVFIFVIYLFLSYKCLLKSIKSSAKYLKFNVEKLLKRDKKRELASSAKLLDSSYINLYSNLSGYYVCLDRSEPKLSLASLEYGSGNYLAARELFFELLKDKNFFSYEKGKNSDNVLYHINQGDYLKYFIYMSISDSSFKVGDIKRGKIYLSKAISFSYVYRMFVDLKPSWIKSLFLRYEYYLQKNKRKLLYYFTYLNDISFIRRRVYLEKNIDKVRGVFKKKYGKGWKKVFNYSLYHQNFYNSDELRNIISKEKDKPYTQIDVRKYFRNFEKEVIEFKESGIDLKEKYPILKTFFYIK